MQTKQEEQVEKMFLEYEEKVLKYAEDVFNDKILPYLKKYRLTFLAGNGTFYIGWTEQTPKWFINKYRAYYHEPNTMIDVDKIDRRISSILFSNVNGYPSNDLGSLMPDYNE